MPHPLQPVRDYFLDCFRKSVGKARGDLDQFATELLLELSRLKHSDYCYRLYRADIVGKKNGKSVVQEITVSEREVLGWHAVFPPAVSIDAPIVWYGIEFEVTGGGPPDEKALLDWTIKWLDITDSRYVESAEFQEVVHSVTPPTVKDARFSLSVDFGSAPTAAFDELLQILARDAKSVSVGSFFLFRTADETPKT